MKEKLTNLNKALLFLIIISVLYLLVSVTYSYFAATISGVEDSTTITLDSGKLEIDYDGGANIVVNNMEPSYTPFATKDFTVTGTNTVSEKYNILDYSITLKVTLNTFSNDSISYSLDGTASNGSKVNKTNTPIRTGETNNLIGNGHFTGEVNNAVHNYTLKVYFLETGVDQSVDMNKNFEAHVVVANKLQFNNKPQLTEGLTPIKFNGLTEVTTTEDDEEWYDYENKMWANAKTDDGSYWVWIPRYAYKISSCYHMNASQCVSETGKEVGDIEILFLDGTTDKTFHGESVSLTPSYSGSKQTNFIKHPSFTFGNDEIEGFWVAKFEMSGSLNNIESKPNNQILESKTIGEMFHISKNLKNENRFNLSDIDTHMIKNIEWGSVLYLSISNYGANDRIYKNNSALFRTGCTGDSPLSESYAGCSNSWNTTKGTKGSTTHNITGIYDMSGGANEYVSAYFVDGNNSQIIENGGPLLNSFNLYGNKYVDTYSNYSPQRLGDAMYETSLSSTSANSWEKGYSHYFIESRSFMLRGGDHAYGSNVTPFFYRNSLGNDGYSKWRVSLIVNN